MDLPLAIVTLGTIQPDDSGATFEQKNEFPDVWACLVVNPLDMHRTPYWVIEGNTRNKPPRPITSPSHHYLYTIDLIIGLHYFDRLQCHLNDY